MGHRRRFPRRLAEASHIALWHAPWITVLGPLLVVALFDLVLLLGSPSIKGWLLVVAVSSAGLIGSWIMWRSTLMVTDSEVIIQNGLFVDKIARRSVQAVRAQRDGVDVYFVDEGSIRVATARATGAAAGYLKGSRTAAVARELALLLDAPGPTDDMRRRARSV